MVNENDTVRCTGTIIISTNLPDQLWNKHLPVYTLNSIILTTIYNPHTTPWSKVIYVPRLVRIGRIELSEELKTLKCYDRQTEIICNTTSSV